MSYIEKVIAPATDVIMSKILERIDTVLETLSQRQKALVSLIYITIFRPRASESELRAFIEKVAGSVGRVDESASELQVPEEEQGYGIPLIVGKSRFRLQLFITRLSDILFYEAMYRRLLDAIEGEAEGGTTELGVEIVKELAEELGVEADGEDKEVLEEVADVTVAVRTEGRVRTEDVYSLVSTVVDESNLLLRPRGIVAKIRVIGYGNEKKLDEIEKKLRERGVSVYRSREKPVLTAVLTHLTQILDKEVYSIIYGSGLPIKILKR